MTQIATLSAGQASVAPARASGRPQAPAATDERAALAKAAQAFEAVFMRQMLSTMRKASLGEGLSDSSSVEQFQEMADARMADSLSTQGGLGIANLILQQLDRKAR